MTDGPGGELALRHPTEADQTRIVGLIDEWFGGRRVRHLVGRAWFRHFGSTSWLAVDPAGRLVGFLIGYRSPDCPAEAVVHLVGVDPNHRRRGVARALAGSFLAEVARAGVTTVTALAWPDDPIAIAVFRALDFHPDDGPGSRNLFGTRAFPDYDGDGEDRVVFVRKLASDGPGPVSEATGSQPPDVGKGGDDRLPSLDRPFSTPDHRRLPDRPPGS
jgi:ribosomal protein S18 acetylase RimI-like enzyme